MIIAFFAVAVIVVVLIVRRLDGGSLDDTLRPPAERDPLDTLKEQFACGKIEKDEFEKRRRLLREK
ncbi:MAG: SHOCT domain-containing protein [Gammaproteobacteria bacterium]|nr:SHOCT domain-containing protein [Gammaproteobacteria bacterium]